MADIFFHLTLHEQLLMNDYFLSHPPKKVGFVRPSWPVAHHLIWAILCERWYPNKCSMCFSLQIKHTILNRKFTSLSRHTVVLSTDRRFFKMWNILRRTMLATGSRVFKNIMTKGNKDRLITHHGKAFSSDNRVIIMRGLEEPLQG